MIFAISQSLILVLCVTNLYSIGNSIDSIHVIASITVTSVGIAIIILSTLLALTLAQYTSVLSMVLPMEYRFVTDKTKISDCDMVNIKLKNPNINEISAYAYKVSMVQNDII